MSFKAKPNVGHTGCKLLGDMNQASNLRDVISNCVIDRYDSGLHQGLSAALLSESTLKTP